MVTELKIEPHSNYTHTDWIVIWKLMRNGTRGGCIIWPEKKAPKKLQRWWLESFVTMWFNPLFCSSWQIIWCFYITRDYRMIQLQFWSSVHYNNVDQPKESVFILKLCNILFRSDKHILDPETANHIDINYFSQTLKMDNVTISI